MQLKPTLLTLLMAASLGCGNPNGSLDFHGDPPQIYGFGCLSATGVKLDASQLNQPPLALKVGETQTFSATVNGGPGGCGGTGATFKRMEWLDLLNGAQRKIQLRLDGCEACTLLYEDRLGQSSTVDALKGAALVNGQQRVTLRVTGLTPGRAMLYLRACADDACANTASDSITFQVR